MNEKPGKLNKYLRFNRFHYCSKFCWFGFHQIWRNSSLSSLNTGRHICLILFQFFMTYCSVILVLHMSGCKVWEHCVGSCRPSTNNNPNPSTEIIITQKNLLFCLDNGLNRPSLFFVPCCDLTDPSLVWALLNIWTNRMSGWIHEGTHHLSSTEYLPFLTLVLQ